MDERQVRLLVVLSAATIAVALIYMLVPSATPDPPWDQLATEPVLQVDPTRVTRLSVEQNGRDRLVIEREGSIWMIREPVAEPADPRRVEAALKRLAKLELGVPIEGEDPSALDLGDPPRARVSVSLESGQTQELEFGGIAPVGFKTYARTGSGAVVAVSGHLDRDLLLDPWTFRDAAVFDFDPADFASVTLDSPQGSLRVDRDAGDVFRLSVQAAEADSPPIPVSRADSQAVENLILTLLDLRLDAFLDNAAPGGVLNPEHRVEVSTRSGQVYEARFGAELPMGRLVQASRGSQGSILPERLAFLGMGPSDLADTSAFPLNSSRISLIEVSIDGRSSKLTRADGGWTATGLDAAAGAELYRALRSVGVDARAQVDLGELGPPSGRVRAELGQDAIRLVQLGRSVGGYRLAKDAGGGEIYAIPEVEIQAVAERLPR